MKIFQFLVRTFSCTLSHPRLQSQSSYKDLTHNMPDKQAIWFLSGTEEPQSMAKPSSFRAKAPYHNLVYFLQAEKTYHKCFGVSGPCSIRLKYPIQMGVPSPHYFKDFTQLLDKTHSSTFTV